MSPHEPGGPLPAVETTPSTATCWRCFHIIHTRDGLETDLGPRDALLKREANVQPVGFVLCEACRRERHGDSRG